MTDLNLPALREAVAKYEAWCVKWSKDWPTEAPPDGAINTYTDEQLIATIRALLDELEALRKDKAELVELGYQASSTIMGLEADANALPLCCEHREYGKSHDGECFGCVLAAARAENKSLREANESVAVCANHTEDIIYSEDCPCVICELQTTHSDLAAARAVLDSAALTGDTSYDHPPDPRVVVTLDRAAWLAWQGRET